MRAESIEQIREHLARGGRVCYRDEEWSKENEEVIRSLVDRGESEEGVYPSRWELVPIEGETPEERQAWIEKAERDFPVDFEKTWKMLGGKPGQVWGSAGWVDPSSSEEFLSLPIYFDEEEKSGEWTRKVKRKGTIAELLEVWDIDDESETSEMAQVLRHLRNYVRGTK